MDSQPARPRDLRADGGFETVCQHYGEHRLAHGGGAAPPIYQTSTFVFPDAESFDPQDDGRCAYYFYTRRSNPTTVMFEAKLARLESGAWARGFASGMGAITAAIGACLHGGAHVVLVNDCYGPTRRYLTQYLARFGVTATFVHGTNPADFLAAFRPETRLVYLESPTSGRFDVLELPPICAAARARGITTILDNSWSTPYFQRPLEMGVDLIVHSATKFIGGHSDTVAGIVVGRDEVLRQKIAFEGELLGASLDPFAAWLLIRGLRTLPVRMEQHQRSGLAIARLLSDHAAVQRVYYPGLESDPQHAVAKRQMRGFSGLLSFALAEQSRAAAHRFVNRLRVFSIGCSWGGYESLALGGDAGVLFAEDADQPRWIIRLHCGLEATDDLLADVQQALED